MNRKMKNIPKIVIKSKNYAPQEEARAFKMQSLIISLLLYTTSQVESTSEHISCDGIIFHDVYFDKELIKGSLGRPNNLVMHKFSGMLFFSHTIQSPTQVDFGIMSCHVEKRDCREINGVPGGYAVAYDAGNDDIYFGGHDGIYKYNFLTKAAEFFAEEGKSIWSIFVRRNFYYIEYPTQKLYVYQDNGFLQVIEAIGIEIDHFYVSRHGDIYFSNRTALYKVERPGKATIVLNDDIAVRQIAEDSYGDVYICGNNGIYIEDRPYHRIKTVANIDQAFGLTFDERDYVVYSDKDAIYRLVKSNNSAVCFNKLNIFEENVKGHVRKEDTISKLA